MPTEFESRFPEIIAALPELIDIAVKAGAETIKEAAVERVPVGEGDVHLRDHFHVVRARHAEYEVLAGDDETWYAHLVEFGTSHSPPHPFLVPAFEERRDVVVEFVNAELHKL